LGDRGARPKKTWTNFKKKRATYRKGKGKTGGQKNWGGRKKKNLNILEWQRTHVKPQKIPVRGEREKTGYRTSDGKATEEKMEKEKDLSNKRIKRDVRR